MAVTASGGVNDAYRQTCVALEKWRNRLGPEPFVPAPGSPIHEDDNAWTYSPLSMNAGGSLSAAVDHLQAVRVLVESGSLHPMATFSLTRAALLGGSTAVWLLAERRPRDRQGRGIACAKEHLEREREWMRDVAQDTTNVIWPNAAYKAVRFEARLRGCDIAFADLYGSGWPQRRPRFASPTSIVGYAANRVTTHHGLRTIIRSHWRSASSDAHGLMWGATQRRADHTGRPSEHLWTYSLAGDFRETVTYMHAAAVVVSWGWRRLDELNSVGLKPDAPTKVTTELVE